MRSHRLHLALLRHRGLVQLLLLQRLDGLAPALCVAKSLQPLLDLLLLVLALRLLLVLDLFEFLNLFPSQPRGVVTIFILLGLFINDFGGVLLAHFFVSLSFLDLLLDGFVALADVFPALLEVGGDGVLLGDDFGFEDLAADAAGGFALLVAGSSSHFLVSCGWFSWFCKFD